MKPLVIYHANCNDGFCAAWIVKKYYPEAELFPANYGEKPPNVEGRKVYIVDFSYKRDLLLQMKEKANSLLILDHHKTAYEDLAGLGFCTFNTLKSGARLAWDNFFGDEIPELVRYVEDRDLWKFKLEFSKEINVYISSWPHDIETWDFLDRELRNNKDFVIAQGTGILRYQSQLVERICKHTVDTKVPRRKEKILAVNTPILQSEVGEYLCKNRPYGVTYFNRGKEVVYSIRSKDASVDVSEIAKENGGGGHPTAAGWKGPAFDIWGRESTF